MSEDNFQDNLDREIEKRINIMESPDYMFPKRFSKADYISSVVVVIACIGFIIYGFYL